MAIPQQTPDPDRPGALLVYNTIVIYIYTYVYETFVPFVSDPGGGSGFVNLVKSSVSHTMGLVLSAERPPRGTVKIALAILHARHCRP